MMFRWSQIRISIGKCSWNSYSSKPAQEVLLPIKKELQVHLTTRLNNIQVIQPSHQKLLGILLNAKLNFKQYVGYATMKVSNGISVIKKWDIVCHENL